jgi:hypothetical protein
LLPETWVRKIKIVFWWVEINPENGGSMFLQNVGIKAGYYKAHQLRRILHT